MTLQAILEEPRPWAFSVSELTAGLRRYTGDSALTVKKIEEYRMVNQRPSSGRIRAISVQCATSTSQNSFKLVVKEPIGATRTGTAGAGRREVALYRTMSEQLPVKVPQLLAYHPEGHWLVLKLLNGGKPPEEWTQANYLAAVDQLVLLHDRFWSLGQDLTAYTWLARPLDGDLAIHIQAATSGVNKLMDEMSTNVLVDDQELVEALEKLVSHAGAIAQRLRAAPSTLLHGDYWPGNIFILPDESLYIIDWQRAGIGPGILDLFTFIQSSGWWFAPLPVDINELVKRYRQGLSKLSRYTWTDEDWEELWDYALMWVFLVDWVDLLASIPNAMLKTRYNQLKNQWLNPVKSAVARRLTDDAG